MTSPTEESFRAWLDERGVLRQDAFRAPDRDVTYAVFAQRSDARLDIEALKRQAERYFTVKIGWTVDKRYGDPPPPVDAARLVVADGEGTSCGTRLCYGRPVEPCDLSAAQDAEAKMGTYGLALLAQRCKTIWLVLADSADDRAALTLAAIFASVMLGPIITPGAQEIFGVQGARRRLEEQLRPYR